MLNAVKQPQDKHRVTPLHKLSKLSGKLREVSGGCHGPERGRMEGAVQQTVSVSLWLLSVDLQQTCAHCGVRSSLSGGQLSSILPEFQNSKLPPDYKVTA